MSKKAVNFVILGMGLRSKEERDNTGIDIDAGMRTDR